MGMIENLKEVLEFAKKLNDASVLKATAELNLECAEMISEKADLTQQNAALREELARLRQQLSAREEELAFEGNVYWKRKDDGSREGPFCPKCFHDKEKVVPMQAEQAEFMADYYESPLCGNTAKIRLLSK